MAIRIIRRRATAHSAVNKCRIVSVNLGHPESLELAGKMAVTGINKRAVSGAVEVTAQGLAGDVIGDPARHGGVDQAVYIFSAEDSQWWAEKMQRAIPPGHFGENLTIDCWWPDVRIGDRIRAGALLLEISFPRIPCGTLAVHMGDVHFLKIFIAARRPGFYARVLAPAAISAGQSVEIAPAPSRFPLAIDLFDLWHDAGLRRQEVLENALASPIAQRARKSFDNWLAIAAGATDKK